MQTQIQRLLASATFSIAACAGTAAASTVLFESPGELEVLAVPLPAVEEDGLSLSVEQAVDTMLAASTSEASGNRSAVLGDGHIALGSGNPALFGQDVTKAERRAAYAAVRKAGRAGQTHHLPALWRFVKAESSELEPMFTLEVLSAMWEIGVPNSAFADLVDQVAERPVVAQQAAFVLARSLDTEHLARIRAAATIAQAMGAPNAAEFAWVSIRAQAALTFDVQDDASQTLAGRVDFLAHHVLSGCVALAPNCSVLAPTHRVADPVATLARIRLHQLSLGSPDAVAAALLSSPLSRTVPAGSIADESQRNELLDHLRDHAMLALCEAAQLEYGRVRPAALNHGTHH